MTYFCTQVSAKDNDTCCNCINCFLVEDDINVVQTIERKILTCLYSESLHEEI